VLLGALARVSLALPLLIMLGRHVVMDTLLATTAFRVGLAVQVLDAL